MTTIHQTATDAAKYFTSARRDNGDTFVKLTYGAPKWVCDMVWIAHGDMFPDGYRYSMIRDAVCAISGLEDDTDTEDMASEIADSMVSVHNADCFAWLASNLDRQYYVDEAQTEGLVKDDTSISDRIAAGWYMEACEVYDLVLTALTERAEAKIDA